MIIISLIMVAFITAIFCLATYKMKNFDIMQIVGSMLVLILSGYIATFIMQGEVIALYDNMIYVDALSSINLLLIAVIGFTASIYSVGYMRNELAHGIISLQKMGFYYCFFHLFIMSMLLVTIFNNLGLLWVGIELTTLISAMLVAFYGNKHSLEAAWKYLIMGVVGIALALLGIVFIYISGLTILLEEQSALQYTNLLNIADKLNAEWIKFGFIFILIGFGTKAGLAPMHFWLPDAHSQAPAPISAVLSGVLLNTALYGILRVYAIVKIVIPDIAGYYLIGFGLLSIMAVVPFIFVQHDLKRLLAFSSVEHIGIITLAVGVGGPIGLYGAFLHMINHSLGKSLLFFAAGSIVQNYRSKYIGRISGVIKSMPYTGIIFLIASMAIAGAPPFSLFISEFTIMLGCVATGKLWLGCLFALLVAIIFTGMSYYVIRMLFGEEPKKVKKIIESKGSLVAMTIPLVFVVIGGFYVMPFIQNAVIMAAKVLGD